MKKTALIVLLTATFFSTHALAQVSIADEPQIDNMLKNFYTTYMSAFTAPDFKHNFEKTIQGLRKRFCTARCQKQIGTLTKATDADPIIKAQDSDEKWAKTLIIKRDQKIPANYHVSYSNDEYGDDHKLHKRTTTIDLIIVKEKGEFKIDKILNGTSGF